MIGVIDESLRYQVRLERLSARVLRLMAGDLNAAIEHVERQLRARTREAAPFTFDRFQALQVELAAVRRALEAQLVAAISEGLAGVTETVVPATAKAFEAASVPVAANFIAPNIGLISQAVAQRFDDKTWPQWGSQLADDVVQRLSSELRQAAFLGEGIPAIRRRFETVSNLSRTSAQRLARTSVNAASNRGRMAVMEANKDIAPNWRYIATLDLKTGTICKSLDQRVFKVGDPDAPLPPRHPSCRSVAVPEVTGAGPQGERPSNPVSENQLVQEFAEKNELGNITKRANLPRGTKGAFDKFKTGRAREIVGQVPASTNYEQWLGRQSVAFQREALGETRWRGWQNGIPMEGFATPDRELTVAELKRIYPKEMANAA